MIPDFIKMVWKFFNWLDEYLDGVHSKGSGWESFSKWYIKNGEFIFVKLPFFIVLYFMFGFWLALLIVLIIRYLTN